MSVTRGNALCPTAIFSPSDRADGRLANAELSPRPGYLKRQLHAKVESKQREKVDRMCNDGIDVIWRVSCNMW